MLVLGWLLSWSGLSSQAIAAGEAPPAFKTCVDYHCDYLVTVQLTSEQWLLIRNLFTPEASASSERRDIQQAIALLEQFVGRQTGTWLDRPGNSGDSMEPGQLDCIAESINTMTYLMLLQQDGLLVKHRVLQRRKRNPWFVDVHWTAVIEDTSDQQHYAVDSWILGNGKPPVIQKLEDWLEKKPIERQ
jgi:hypothetical protein